MAITNGLITSAEYASYAGVAVATDPLRTTSWEQAITVASRWVEKHTGRQFHETDTGDTPTPSARYFDNIGDIVHITDCQSVTAIATDTGDDGNYATTLTTTDYQLLPVGGWDDLLGQVPYTEIKQLSWGVWPCTVRERPVKVTGLWGWTAVPSDVKHACALVAQDRLRDPETKVGGLTIAGDGIVLGARNSSTVLELLLPYVRVIRAPGIQVA